MWIRRSELETLKEKLIKLTVENEKVSLQNDIGQRRLDDLSSRLTTLEAEYRLDLRRLIDRPELQSNIKQQLFDEPEEIQPQDTGEEFFSAWRKMHFGDGTPDV